MTNPIQTWRAEHQLSCEEAGKRVGVSGVTWWRWENGHANIGISRLLAVARLTGLSGVELRPDIFAPEVWQECDND